METIFLNLADFVFEFISDVVFGLSSCLLSTNLLSEYPIEAGLDTRLFRVVVIRPSGFNGNGLGQLVGNAFGQKRLGHGQYCPTGIFKLLTSFLHLVTSMTIDILSG